MPKFLAIHTLPAPVTIQGATPLAKKVKALNTAVDAYWVGSWLQLNEAGEISKILCEWNAVNVEAIRRELAKVPELRTDGIYPMAKIDSEEYR